MRSALLFLAAVAVAVSFAPAAQADTADIVFVVDESGSMSTEHAWIGSMVASLDAALNGAGVTGNQYALVGFGGVHAGGPYQAGHMHAVGGGDWGTAGQLAAATAGLIDSGGFEDGWQATDYVLNNYTFRAGAALNIILITDEDRDYDPGAPGAGLTYAGVLAELNRREALLNVVVDYVFKTSANVTALGEDAGHLAYLADGAGGFTTAPGATETLGYERQSYNVNNKTAYIDLAWATGGAGWDLQQLRVGGLTADSFTAAFVDIKVGEIQQQIPEPASLALLVLGLGGLMIVRRMR